MSAADSRAIEVQTTETRLHSDKWAPADIRCPFCFALAVWHKEAPGGGYLLIGIDQHVCIACERVFYFNHARDDTHPLAGQVLAAIRKQMPIQRRYESYAAGLQQCREALQRAITVSKVLEAHPLPHWGDKQDASEIYSHALHIFDRAIGPLPPNPKGDAEEKREP